MATFNLAIDGPAGAGKSTIAKAVARRLFIPYLDTGALYRSMAWYALKQGISPKDEPAVEAMLPDFRLELRFEEGEQELYVNGERVTKLIREPEISQAASDISALPAVRAALLGFQRDIAAKQDCVLDGRDIGSYVLPNAQLKIFLTAAADERARRRLLELQQRGVETSFDAVLADMQYRDHQDSTRAVAPLCKTEDAVAIDSTDKSIEEVVGLVVRLAEPILKELRHG